MANVNYEQSNMQLTGTGHTAVCAPQITFLRLIGLIFFYKYFMSLGIILFLHCSAPAAVINHGYYQMDI